MDGRTRFTELLREFAEIFCDLGDYDWDSDFGEKEPEAAYLLLPTYKQASGGN